MRRARRQSRPGHLRQPSVPLSGKHRRADPNILDVFTNDDPGTILNIYRSAGAAIGKHVVTARATVKFPGTGKVTFGDGVQGRGGYQLTYTIRRG